MFEESIFKAYDIRGIFGKQFSPEFAQILGRAYASHLGCTRVAVGRDARKSSPLLFNELIKGLTEQGCEVLDLGQCTTPSFYYAVGSLGLHGGIMITASHNPAEYNGFKLCREEAIPIGENNGMQEIKRRVLEHDFLAPKKRGKILAKSHIDEYCRHLLSLCPKLRKLKVVIDAGNGMAGLVAERLFSALPIEIIPMYFEPDMSFPNHEANPLNFSTLRDLQERVVKEGADLGIAFDGDGDRVFFVDEKGSIVQGDLATALIAQSVLEKHPAGKVLYDLRSSWAVREAIINAGGTAEMCRVGHAFIKKQMRESGAVFAGELSGHFYFKENFHAESGMLASLKVMGIMSQRGRRLSELVAPLRKYFQSGEINLKVDSPWDLIRRVELKYSGKKINHLDGLMVENRDYWFNLRPSNTEPLLRLNIEAKSPEILEKVKSRLLRELSSSQS